MKRFVAGRIGRNVEVMWRLARLVPDQAVVSALVCQLGNGGVEADMRLLSLAKA